MNKPLASGTFLMEKIPGKGGWTYVALPKVSPDKNAPFGWRKVKGTIDDYEIKRYHLMPMGNGKLFLPVKAEIRKKIRKQAGDRVRITLFPDDSLLEIPAELLLCLQDEPAALSYFNSLRERDQEDYIKWIYSVKTLVTRDERMAKAITKLSLRQKCFEQPKE